MQIESQSFQSTLTFGFTPMGSWSFQKIPQYVEETSQGVPPASPTFKAFGNLASFTPSRDNQVLNPRWIGNRDIQGNQLLGVSHAFDIVYTPADITVLKYGTELPAGTGTSEKSLTVIFSSLLNGVEKYMEYLGCLCDKVGVKITRAGGVQVTQSFFAKDVKDWVAALAAPITTPTYASAPAAEGWTGISSGADPLTWNGTTYPTNEFNFDVTQNVQKIETNGTSSYEYAAPTNRDITFSFVNWTQNTTLIGDLTTYTPRTLSYKMAVVTGTTYTATFTNAAIDSYKVAYAAGGNDFVKETFSGKARSISLTSST